MVALNGSINALIDIEFLITTKGRMSVRSLLLSAHDPDVRLDLGVPAYVYTAQLRLLAAVLAVVLRYEQGFTRSRASSLADKGLSEAAVDGALNSLKEGTNLFDEYFPFMQRPALNTDNPKQKDTFVGPGGQPVKKLSPAMPPDEAEDFWNLLVKKDEWLSKEDGVLDLVVYHHLSMAGNNSYAGDKCVSGAPAMRFVGIENSATEVMWQATTLLRTIMCMVPWAWVEGDGLPAWADRECRKSRIGAEIHPLWKATWSSNTVATAWVDDRLVGVRTGGVPAAWFPLGNADKEWSKEWWNARNESDPFYLYIERDNELKLQRLDLGKDITALATDWAAENKTERYLKWCQPRVLSPGESDQLAFARHRIEGTASSPNIRASEILIPRTDQWAHDLDELTQQRIAMSAQTIERLQRIVCSPFRREGSNERTGNRVPLVLDFLHGARPTAVDAFWRHIASAFSLMLKECREAGGEFLPSEELCKSMREASLAAFDEVTQPYFGQEPARISHVRAGIYRRVAREISDFRSQDAE